MLKSSYHWFPVTALLISISGCAPLNVQVSELDPLIEEEKPYTIESTYSDFETMLKKAGCQNFRSYVWNYIYKIVSTENGKPPPYYTVKEKITQRMQKLMKHHSAPKEAIQNFARQFVEIYALVTELMDQHQEEEATETLVQLEHGIAGQSHTDFTNRLKQTFLELDKSAKILNKNCPEENETYASDNRSTDPESMQKWDIKWFYTMRKTLHPLVYGARKIMSTAYQSCSVLDLPLMPVGYKTKGIHVVSRHRSGNGWLRAISNLDKIRQSHYYLSQTSISDNRQCLNTYDYPLIYDYGGKPSTALHSINLFKNAGSGSKSLLGMDCSGFVASAMASSGLRLKPGVFIRPIHVKGISAWMFKNAHKYTLSCLQQQDISINNPIRPGDIIASNTHIFIVDSVGPDPFSLLTFSHPNECHSYSIKLSKFRFSIIQSSAHNNGVGINRMHVRDAVDGLNVMNRGLKRTASRACYKMFGKDTHKNIGEIAILRHASHESACRDREIYLENQECLKSCTPQSL